jgi:hypothetical protein
MPQFNQDQEKDRVDPRIIGWFALPATNPGIQSKAQATANGVDGRVFEIATFFDFFVPSA